MSQQGGEPPPSIVGKWTYKHDAGPIAVEEYTYNNKMYLSVPMMKENSRYAISNGTLVIDMDKGRSNWNVLIKDDMLTMTNIEDGKVEKYKRKK
jgi:hypothetical protein